MKKPMNRRRFLQSALVVPLAAIPASAAAQPADKPQEREAAILQAQTEILRQRFGKFLTEENLKEVQQALRGDQASAALLRTVRLENGDEPDFVFAAEVE